MKPADFSRDLERCIFRRKRAAAGRRSSREQLGLTAKGGEAFDRQHLLAEDQTELAGGLMGDRFERGQLSWALATILVPETGDGPVCDATRVDQLEVAQVGGDVECESVRGNAARHMDADGADLALSWTGPGYLPRGLAKGCRYGAPDTGQAADPSGRDTIDAADADESFLHHADEIDWPQAAA